LNVESKVLPRKEVTSVEWAVAGGGAIVRCADGSQYQADHVIFTASLGVLKNYHERLFTPRLPLQKTRAIESLGFGNLGKIFLEFAVPFWPTDVNEWATYSFLWTEADVAAVRGTDREWLIDIPGFIRVDSFPNVIGAFVTGFHMTHFEQISEARLIDDCMWLLERTLGRTLPRPTNMLRNQFLTNPHFFGSYSYLSMDTYNNQVSTRDLAATLLNNALQPVLLFAGEATDYDFPSYANGAVSSGWRAGQEIVDFYQ